MSASLDIFSGFYAGKRVLVTGHTGFKGSWLTIWLRELGAQVWGVALDPDTPNDNFVLSGLADKMGAADIRCDIRDREAMREIFERVQPQIVFHLAAQPLVRLSYECPVETYEVNVMGTINVLEAIRHTPSVRVGVMITTDKCYENREQIWGYRETDAMGGYDPYSSSKGAAEIAISSWRRSFFNPQQPGSHPAAIASVRAGNVIGGGDWCRDRIIPDCIRALEAGRKIEIRSPRSVRPWQHVLEPLSGYMLLAQKLWDQPALYAEGWNFGPNPESTSTVWEVASLLAPGELVDASRADAPHEAQLLTLDITKARARLGWRPRLTLPQCIDLVREWYQSYPAADVYSLCVRQIIAFLSH